MMPHWIVLVIVTMLVNVSWCVLVNASTTLAPVETHAFTFEVKRGDISSGVLVNAKLSIDSTIPIPDEFFGWLYSTSHCDMSDVPTRTSSTFGVVVVTEYYVERCGATAVVNHVRIKHLRGVLELSANESGLQNQLWMQDSPWIMLFAPISTIIENSMIQDWTWFDLHDVRIRPTTRIESTNRRHGSTWIIPRVSRVTSTSSVSTLTTTTTLEPVVTITNKSHDHGDSSANARASLILYIAVGTVCGGLAGLMILCTGRHLHSCVYRNQHERHGQQQRHGQPSQQHQISQAQSLYEDDITVSQSRDEMECLLQAWPVGLYPTKLAKVFCEGDDGTKPCAVCFEDMQGSPRCRVLPCCHVFHAECIDPWLRQRPTCPICVSNVIHHRPPMTAWALVEQEGEGRLQV